MRLYDPQVVIDRLSLRDAGSSITTVENAVNGATDAIGGLLDSALHRAERIDYFNAPCESSTYYKSGRVKLYLDQAFIDATVLPVMYLNPSSALIDPAAPPATTGDFVPDYERGLITALTPPTVPVFGLAVRYTAGFAEAAPVAPATVGFVMDAPAWLVEAAVQETIRILMANGQRFAQIDKRDRLNDTIRLRQAILDEHHRPRTGYLFPKQSVIVPP